MKLIISFILGSILAFGDSISIEPLALSYHFNRDKDWNEDHKYLGLLYKHDSGFEIGVGTMENSHYKRSNSIYAGYSKEFYEYTDGEIGAFIDAGYRTGYKRNLLIYGGIYAEYKNVYIKTAIGSNLIGCTIGYQFKFKGIK